MLSRLLIEHGADVTATTGVRDGRVCEQLQRIGRRQPFVHFAGNELIMGERCEGRWVTLVAVPDRPTDGCLGS